LRSSVVSVLISLISDIWVIGPYNVNYIFFGSYSCVALLQGPGSTHQS
ncbi:unnamed protein product, partial [Brassica oleracea var. botrytis]